MPWKFGERCRPVSYVPSLAQRLLRLGRTDIMAHFGGPIGMSAPAWCVVALTSARSWRSVPPVDALQELDRLIAQLPASEPFGCGYAVALPYGLGHACDSAIPLDRNSDQSHLRACRVDSCIVADEIRGVAWLCISEEADASAESELLAALDAANRMQVHVTIPESGILPADWASDYGELSRSEYRSRIGAILEAISSGDYYECNFTQRFTIPSTASPASVAQKLLAAPARHFAWLNFGGDQIISASPEQFLRVADGRIVTGPIKGTARRHADTRLDSESRNALRLSVKDRAEHTMVVDMARNDLGRVCRPATVEVKNPYLMESHPHVIHMVSSVEGELQSDVPLSRMLMAAFPPASITGTPKIAAARAIADLEASGRGIYTGSLGLVGRDWLDLNVAIRTIHACQTASGYRFEFGAGGAIVADSDPDAEYEECLLKARPLAHAILSAQ